MSAQLQACQCAPDPAALEAVVLPSTHDGLLAPALRFGDPRVMALLACLCAWQHLFAGLTNRSLRELVAGLIPGYSARQATYDLRRLRRKGLIHRVPRSQRYELTDHGRMIAVLFTKTHTPIVNPALAELDLLRRKPHDRSDPRNQPKSCPRALDFHRSSIATARHRGWLQLTRGDVGVVVAGGEEDAVFRGQAQPGEPSVDLLGRHELGAGDDRRV